jgi:hypothetical protein
MLEMVNVMVVITTQKIVDLMEAIAMISIQIIQTVMSMNRI